MKKGFTLIELLVVVLIIAILAAVALPQYQKAVVKSRVSEMLLIAKRVQTEQDMYMLQNDKPTANMVDLLSECTTAGATCIFNNKYSISMTASSDTEYYFQIKYTPAGGQMPFIEYNNSPWPPWGGLFCVAQSSTVKDQVCQTFGTLHRSNTTWNTNYYLIK
ncbi:prepilin-type N-terminal cleavage/methylation domain-containing protein [Parelusimicrobium proximum]|uniref:type IV pilin protein n=1 Tax=Parelusimicrobium proximum TaxID=3228953 RepID=UPI003D17420C